MRILLDTCTFLWLAGDSPALSSAARDACRDPSNEVLLSALSGWEIAIKYRLGRLPLPEPPPAFVSSRREALQLGALPFSERAACHVHLLPDVHRDPFDRGLVAQALTEGLTLVTPDPHIREYPVLSLW